MKAKLTPVLVSALAAVCFAQEDSGNLNELSLGSVDYRAWFSLSV